MGIEQQFIVRGKKFSRKKDANAYNKKVNETIFLNITALKDALQGLFIDVDKWNVISSPGVVDTELIKTILTALEKIDLHSGEVIRVLENGLTPPPKPWSEG